MRKLKKGSSIALLLLGGLTIWSGYAYSQDLLPADSIPKAVKEKLKFLYPDVNPESKDVWWSPYALMPKGYWVNFITESGRTEIHFTEKGDTVNTIYLSGGFHYIKMPLKLKKIIDSIFPDAERIQCQANGDDGLGHIGDAKEKAQPHDSNDGNISIYLALARYAFDADKHSVRIDYEHKVLTQIVIDNPDSTLLPSPISAYLKKNYSDCVIEVLIKYFEHRKTKYQVTVGKYPWCGKQYILNFNSSGKLKKSTSFNKHCGDFL